jgi:hypothetical protein
MVECPINGNRYWVSASAKSEKILGMLVTSSGGCVSAGVDEGLWMLEELIGQGRGRFIGICDRENGPAIEELGGSKIWIRMGKHHRAGGPAVEASEPNETPFRTWYENGKFIRKDGGVGNDLTGRML